MFAEPPRTEFDLRFRTFGIPVRVHPLFWLVSAVLGWNEAEPRDVLIWIPAVFVSILVHELGHALCSRTFGNKPWIVLYSFGGLACYQERWNTTTWERVVTSFCGPLAGFLLAGVVIGLMIGLGSPQSKLLSTLVTDLLWINIAWGMVNLLPIWPLDGGMITFYLLHRLSPSRGPAVARGLSAVSAGLLAAAGWILFKSIFLALFFGFLAVQSLQGRGRYR